MKKDNTKEKIFIKKVEKGEFKFSYSSLNKLMFSPSLFYKDYILEDREVKTDKHLIEGKLIHLLILQPEEFKNKFMLMPSKMPSDALCKVLKNISLYTDENKLSLVKNDIILNALSAMDLYQSFKDDDKRIAKVLTTECEDYYLFCKNNNGKDIIDNDILTKCTDSVEIIKNNKSIMNLLSDKTTDFEMDNLEIFNEKYLTCSLTNFDFGLHGSIDRYVINHDTKEVKIIDIKTTSKTIVEFPETIEFYNYWLQAATYVTLVQKNINKSSVNYKINFNFIVIDKYNQIYNFEVSNTTMNKWGKGLEEILNVAKFHIKENNYELPYQFLQEKQIIL
jgi:hypothetical protein